MEHTILEPDWLLSYRQKNLEIFQRKPLVKSQYFDVSKLDSLLNTNTKNKQIALPKQIERKDIRVISLDQALKEIPKKIKFILENEEPPKNQYEAFINANFNTGFVIIIKESATPDSFVNYTIEETKGLIVKNIIIVEQNTQNLKVLENLKGEVNHLNQTIFLEEGSKMTFVRLFDISKYGIINSQTLLEKDAALQSSNVFLNGNLISARIVNSLKGIGSSLEQLDISLLDKEQFLNLDLLSIHKAENAKSYSILKAVLKESSKNLFDGMIKILPTGQKANALLEAHSLLLSKNASSNNIPSLEIEADDVRATHSATVSNLDEEQLFYLESRGITQEDAKHTIIKGFLESIMFKLPNDYTKILSKALETKIKNAN